MNPKQLADLLGVSSNSIRRWSAQFADYLTPSANPDKGETRLYTAHDVRVMHYVATMRSADRDNDDIGARLAELKAVDWDGLPTLPDGWPDMERQLPANWNVGAVTLAQISVLQSELSHIEDQRDRALQRVEFLETEVESLRNSNQVTDRELQDKEIELQKARSDVIRIEGELKADVARLEGQLQQYSFGREKPVNVGLIIAVALAAGALLVIVAFVVARLVM